MQRIDNTSNHLCATSSMPISWAVVRVQQSQHIFHAYHSVYMGRIDLFDGKWNQIGNISVLCVAMLSNSNSLKLALALFC